MTKIWQTLRQRWRWWAIPMALTLLAIVLLHLLAPEPREIPLHYDIPR